MVSATAAIRKSDCRFEHFVLPGLALLILAFVFVRFSRTYYLAGMFRAPLPNLSADSWRGFYAVDALVDHANVGCRG